MEDSPTLPKILCKNLPEALQDKKRILDHFRQFGKVVKVQLRSKHNTWAIQYDNWESVQLAISKGGKYGGQAFEIQRNSGRKKAKKHADPDWLPDPEVQKELEAMANLGDPMFKRSYSLRPEGMVVDSFSPPNKESGKTKWKPTINRQRTRQSTDRINIPVESVCSAEEIGLISVIKQPALTLEDQFRVLDARDKFIRLKTKKSLDIMSTGHLIGTCPDMCPEKERIMREVQHQVAVYEQDVGGKGMNHTLAVKQYSRSSADQEVPLPHELRPVSVLQLTMDYLMHHIMNICDLPDINIAEWYHFLWDRTRSIRKDITQQALGCQGSVILLEQCARFHIHCSAYLVAEDVSVFDPKINTENLTKCLQTLKYMYHDLHIKGQKCPNEAEFRAYIILLNLNDGNFMWEVQRLQSDIQKSPEVKFALEVYSALSKNNYIKFFKLVHSTTYLNACILLQYFVQVRTKALLMLVRCYSPRSPYSQFSLVELETLLAFENIESVKDFVLAFGLTLNETSSHVLLNRNNYCSVPIMPVGLDRATLVVESKKLKSVGEIVCGTSTFPSLFKHYSPSSSFKEDGTFIISVALKILIEKSKVPEEVDTAKQDTNDSVSKSPDVKPFWSPKSDTTPSVFKSPDAPSQQSIFGTSAPKEGGFTFKFGNVTNQQAPSIFGGPSFTEKPNEIFGPSKKFTFGLPQPTEINAPPENDPKQQYDELNHIKLEIEKQKQLELEKQRQSEIERQKQLEFERQVLLQKQHELELRKQFEMKKQIQLEEQRRVQLENQKKRQLELALQKQLEMEMQAKLEMERQKQMELERQQRIKREKELEQKRLEEERRKRQEMLLLEEKERRLNDEIRVSVQKLIQDLLTETENAYKKTRLKEISDSARCYKQRLFVQKWRNQVAVRKKKRHAIDQNPVWLPTRTTKEEADELFTASQALSLQNMKRYKLGRPTDIIIPNQKPIERMNVPLICKSLMNSYAKLGLRAQTEIFWKLTVSLPDIRELNIGLGYVENVLTDFFSWKDRYGTTVLTDKYVADKHFYYSVEKKQGVHSIDGNSNGLLFILSTISDTTLKRITLSFQALPKSCNVPIACVIIGKNNNNLQALKNIFDAYQHHVNYTILSCAESAIIEVVKESLMYLVKNVEKPPPLELYPLEQFLKVYLTTELWKKAASYSTWNAMYKKCLKVPNVVIDLHNEAVDRLKEIILDDSCLQYQDFCDDFELANRVPDNFPANYRYFPPFWKSESYRLHLSNILKTLKLPRFNVTWPPATLSDLEDMIASYVSQIFEDPSVIFIKLLTILLKDIDPPTNFCDIRKASWIDAIELVVLEKIEKSDFMLRLTEFHTKSVFQELIVVYDVAKLDSYNYDEWFYLKNKAIQCEIENQSKTKCVKRKRPEPAVFDYDLDELEKSVREETVGTSKTSKMKSSVKEMEVLMADLEKSMKIHKSVCGHVQTTLAKVLGVTRKQ